MTKQWQTKTNRTKVNIMLKNLGKKVTWLKDFSDAEGFPFNSKAFTCFNNTNLTVLIYSH